MQHGPRIAHPLLVATCLALAGCGGPALLKQPSLLETVRPLAEGRDERIQVTIEAVILRNGRGAWARDAEWDEYVLRVRSHSDESVEIRRVAIIDALGHRVEPRPDLEELVAGTREVERRYRESAKPVMPRPTSDWVVAGAGTATTAAIVAGSSSSSFLFSTGAMAATGAVMGVGLVFVGAGVVRMIDNARVDREILRRRTTLPVDLPARGEARVDLFFPLVSLAQRLQVGYADRQGEHRLDIDTGAALGELERDVPPSPVYRTEPRFPDQARRAGLWSGYVRANLTLTRDGAVQSVEVIESMPSSAFKEEARRTFQQWKYTEGRDDGRVIEARLDFRR